MSSTKIRAARAVSDAWKLGTPGCLQEARGCRAPSRRAAQGGAAGNM